jgi:hypothetical protein
VLAIMPGITGDTSHAFSTMPEATRATLAPRPDDQLATLASAKRSTGTRVRKTSRKTAIMPRTIPASTETMLHDPSPIAADDTFHALTTLSAAQQFSLAPLSDDQLAAAQGKEGFPHELLLQLINPLCSLLDPATLATLGQTSSMMTQSSSQTQQNMGGGMQMNVNEVRQH